MRHRLPILTVIALAVGLRVVALKFNDHIGSGDQACYLQGAQDILRGHLGAGVFPPGYPALIAVALRLGAPLDRANQVVCLALGCILVLIIWQLGARALGAASGVVAAGLAAVHPELIRRSSDGMSETSFMVMIYGALLLCVLAVSHSVQRRRLGLMVGAGTLFGWAYLTRPEGLIYCVSATVAVALCSLGGDAHAPARRHVGLCCAVLLPACVCVGAYVIGVVHPSTGRWSPTLKSLAWQQAYEEGAEEAEAAHWGIGQSGSGPSGSSPSVTVQRALVGRALRNYPKAYWDVMPRQFDLALTAAFVLGLLALSSLGARGQLGGILLSPLAMLTVLPLAALTERLYVPVIPCVLLFASFGILAIPRLFADARAGRLAPTALIAILVLAYAKPDADLVRGRHVGAVALEEKVAARWLDEHAPLTARLMERKSSVGFYARRPTITIPWGSLTDIVAYAREHNVDYLVVSQRYVDLRPQLSPLLGNTPLEADGLRLLYDAPTPATWTHPARIRLFQIVR